MVYHSNSHRQPLKSVTGRAIRKPLVQPDEGITHVLGEPTETFAVTLPLDNRNHEEFDRADVVEGDLALG